MRASQTERERELRDNWRKEKKKELQAAAEQFTSAHIERDSCSRRRIHTHTSFTCYWDQTPKQRENGEWKQKNPTGEREHTEYGRSRVHTITIREAEQSSTTYVRKVPYWKSILMDPALSSNLLQRILRILPERISSYFQLLFAQVTRARASADCSEWDDVSNCKNEIWKRTLLFFTFRVKIYGTKVHGEHSFGRHSRIICDKFRI